MKALNALKLMLLLYLAPNLVTEGQRRRRMRDDANVSLGAVGALAFTVVAVVVAAVVALIVLATLFPTYSGAVKNLSQNVSSADWGNTTANALNPVFSLVISLGGLFAIMGLAFLAYKLKAGGKGGLA